MSSRARLAASRCIFASWPAGALDENRCFIIWAITLKPERGAFLVLCSSVRNSRGPADARKFLVDRPLWIRGCTKRRRAPALRPLKQRKNASRLLVHRRSHPKWLPRPPRSPPSSSTAPSPVRTAPSPVHRVSRVFRVSERIEARRARKRARRRAREPRAPVFRSARHP